MSTIFSTIKKWFRSSIRLQVMSGIGAVVTIIMVIISIAILLQWRSLILEEQQNNAKSFARALSIPVLEILIDEPRLDVQSAGMLETHIHTFMDNVEGLLHISIMDNANIITAHSDLMLYGLAEDDEDIVRASSMDVMTTRIFKDEGNTWLIEVVHPLMTGQKRWGTLVMGFDAGQTYSKIRNTFFLLLFLTILAIVATLSLLYYYINRVFSSLRNIVAEVDKIDITPESKPLLKQRPDEIGVLVEHFEKLQTRLNESKQQLDNAQKQIFQAEKLASIGRLASGVAHEVNNPLNGMRFCVYGIQNGMEDKEQVDEYLNLINEGLSQIESVVTKLLGYSRQRPKKAEKVNINREIRIVLDLLEYRISKEQVKIELQEDPTLPYIKADVTQIQEMLMNLLLNSLDAIGKKGIIRIKTQLNAEGGFILSVWDNGTGIPDEEREKIFDPFYSTKETGKGTGLGLSVTLGIVEAHNGKIELESNVGEFTEFKIHLPQ